MRNSNSESGKASTSSDKRQWQNQDEENVSEGRDAGPAYVHGLSLTCPGLMQDEIRPDAKAVGNVKQNARGNNHALNAIMQVCRASTAGRIELTTKRRLGVCL